MIVSNILSHPEPSSGTHRAIGVVCSPVERLASGELFKWDRGVFRSAELAEALTARVGSTNPIQTD
jgi:hypothetical protein